MTLLAERVQTSSKSHFSASLPAGAGAQQQHWAAHGRGRATSTHQACTKRVEATPAPLWDMPTRLLVFEGPQRCLCPLHVPACLPTHH